MWWLFGFLVYVIVVLMILAFFKGASMGEDPVDNPPERSEIDSWPR